MKTQSIVLAASPLLLAGALLAACNQMPVMSTGGSSSSASSAWPGSTPFSAIGPDGGYSAKLAFAVTGDSRPATVDDLGGYPTDIINTIWSDIEMEGVPFALATGDYINSTAASDTSAMPQMLTYAQAEAGYSGMVFPIMGNHECKTHKDNGNCGAGNTDGLTNNYQAFMNVMLAPLGISSPNYKVRVDAWDGSWTAKFVMIAGNSWSADDATWFDHVLSEPTTYTFIVRHQDVTATDAPGVIGSAPIMANHPYTLLLCSHIHSFEFDAASRQVVNGNGGAPPDSAIDYGYTVIRRKHDGTLVGENYDYLTHAVQGSFHVDADGNVVP